MTTDKNQLMNFLEQQYPNAHIKFVGDGWSSTAFSVGNKIVRFPKRDIGEYERESKLLPIVRKFVDIPVPDVMIKTNCQYPYSVHTTLHGKQWQEEDHETSAQPANDCGRFLARLHKTPIADITHHVCNIPTKNEWSIITYDEVAGFLKKHVLKNDLNKIYDIYVTGATRPTENLVLCHSDFSSNNSVIDTNHHLCGVYDWASASLAEPAYDFIRMLTPKSEFIRRVIADYTRYSGTEIKYGRVLELCLLNYISALHTAPRTPQMAPWRNTVARYLAQLSGIIMQHSGR